MTESLQTQVDEESVEKAVVAEDELSEDDKTDMHSLRRELGFYPCRITEFRNIKSGEFTKLSSDDFDENHVVFRNGFGMVENENLSDIGRRGIGFPNTRNKDVVTVKYELVGADEEWSMREFWTAEEFPKRSFVRAIPSSRIGNIIGKIVPVTRQPTYNSDKPDRRYIISSLAEESFNYSDKKRSVPGMTIRSTKKNFLLKCTSAFTANLMSLALIILGFGASSLRVTLSIVIPCMITISLMRPSAWFYKRVASMLFGSELPSNPYHNQFDSVSEFAEETKR